MPAGPPTPPDDDREPRLLRQLAAVPWALAIGLVLFTVLVGGVISIFDSRYSVTDYFRNVSIVTAALLLAIGGYNGSKLK